MCNSDSACKSSTISTSNWADLCASVECVSGQSSFIIWYDAGDDGNGYQESTDSTLTQNRSVACVVNTDLLGLCRLDPPASSFSARSCVAGVNAKLARTSPINPMQCTAWSPAGFDVLCSTAPMDTSVNLTTYFDQRQQVMLRLYMTPGLMVWHPALSDSYAMGLLSLNKGNKATA